MLVLMCGLFAIPPSAFGQRQPFPSGGVSAVSSLPATCTPGTTAPVNLTINGVGYGVFYCSATNTWVPDNPSGTISPLAYGGKFDVKFVYDATFTNGSATVTCPQNDCNFTQADVGKIVFGTNEANIASQIGTGLITAQNTILTVNGAQSITMSATASASCTAASAQLCPLAWGTQDDSTAINAAATAAWGTSGRCIALQFPSANYFFSSALMNMSITQLSQACGGSQAAASISGIDTTQVGPTAFGQGMSNSVGIPLPSFNFATCTGGVAGTACFGGTANLQIHDLGINGLGQTLNGSPHTNNLVDLFGSSGGGQCTGSTGYNLGFAGWGVQSSGSVGIAMGGNACGDPQYSNIISEQFGATNCSINSSYVVSVNALACLGATTRVLLVTCSSNSQIVNTTASEFVDMDAAGPTITQQNCIWNSYGDHINANIASASNTLYQNTSTVGSTTNFTGVKLALIANTGGSQAFLSTAPAVPNSIHCKGCNFDIGTTNNKLFNVNSSFSFFDEGGNNFSLAGTVGAVNSVFTGQYIFDGHGVKGTCTGVATASQTLGLYGTGPNETLTTCTSTAIGSGLQVQGSRTLMNLIVNSTAGGVNGSSGVVTVLKNGVGTAITCTLGTTTNCVDTTHSVSAVYGDLISIQFTTQAVETLAGVKAVVGWN